MDQVNLIETIEDNRKVEKKHKAIRGGKGSDVRKGKWNKC